MLRRHGREKRKRVARRRKFRVIPPFVGGDQGVLCSVRFRDVEKLLSRKRRRRGSPGEHCVLFDLVVLVEIDKGRRCNRLLPDVRRNLPRLQAGVAADVARVIAVIRWSVVAIVLACVIDVAVWRYGCTARTRVDLNLRAKRFPHEMMVLAFLAKFQLRVGLAPCANLACLLDRRPIESDEFPPRECRCLGLVRVRRAARDVFGKLR